MIGITKLDDDLKKLDKIINEEARTANAEMLRIAYENDKNAKLAKRSSSALPLPRWSI